MTGEDSRATANGAADSGEAGSVCHQCGATGQTDLFCDSCGAVLRARASGDAGGFFSPPAADAPGPGPAAELAAVPSAKPKPIPTPLPASLSETNGAGWDAATEWGHILAAESAPAAHQPTDAAPTSSAPSDAASPAPAEPAAPAPRQRGPYEFTSRRVEAAPEPAAAPEEPAARRLSPEQQPGAAGILSALEGTAPLESDGGLAPLPALGEDLGPSRSLDAPPPRSATDRTPTLPASAVPSARPSVPSQNDLQLRARELIVPVADSEAVEQRIVPVPPGMPQPARPGVRTPEVHEVVGGVPCPWCSTPNPVDRHFCRRCAMSLAAGPGAARRLPWWRRLLNWRRREVPYAGQRPRLRHGIGRVVRRVALLALLIFVIVEISVNAGTGVTNVEDHFATPVQVYADKITTSSQDPQHLAKLLGDGYNNTYWGSDQTGNNVGVYVEATFNQPIALMDVIVTPGATTQQNTFIAQSRPETMGVTLYKDDGTQTQTTITFNDSVGAETFKVRGNDIAKIRFTVKSIYPGSGPDNSTELAITQLEFFARNASHS
jgi:hypothetical protein